MIKAEDLAAEGAGDVAVFANGDIANMALFCVRGTEVGLAAGAFEMTLVTGDTVAFCASIGQAFEAELLAADGTGNGTTQTHNVIGTADD